MYNAKAIAKNIYNERQLKQYSQDYMCYRLNISQNAYSKIERGITKLTVQRAIDIADVLEINLEDLIQARLRLAM